ncbi:MAG TPA: hypothetical protein VNO24_20925, partial [Blastocatellia bacterium]|nr:hypothetical protein [Blastocatellia bacterium]
KHKAALACGHLDEDGLQFIEALFAFEQLHWFLFSGSRLAKTKVKTQGCECKITGVPGCA